MEFKEKLENYAELLVRVGLNVQPQQEVQISAEVVHRDFVLLIVEKCYAAGAKYVNVDFVDSRLARARIKNSESDNLAYVPDFTEAKYRALVNQTSANLRLLGSENPDILADLDPILVNKAQLGLRKKLSYFYEEGIGKSLVHWTVAAASTPAWAKKVFPEFSPQEAHVKLWDCIFAMCRADQKDCIELWSEHNRKLISRGEQLTALEIKELRFIGAGTNLTVGLSPRALFRAGTDISPRGVAFEANIPTEEVFTTPDYRCTHGTVRATRPFLVNGKLIENLVLEFQHGKITSFSASAGESTFAEYIKSDDGASRLGEVALVGIDSPVYKTGRVFQEILFDENAACHIAIGSAYKFCLKDGAEMSEEGLQAIGCNNSRVHTDMMISSEEVDVSALTYSGKVISLLEKGQWVFP